MARLSMSTLRTVRFYEEEGILRPIARTDGGHRLFERFPFLFWSLPFSAKKAVDHTAEIATD